MTVLIFTLLISLMVAQAVQIRAPTSTTINSTDPSSTEILSVISIKSNFSTISPDGKILLLYNSATNSIGVYDVSNLESPTLSSSISLESPSQGLVSAVISPDSKTGYIVHEYLNEGALSIYDLTDILSPVRLSPYGLSGSGPIALSPDAKTLFIWDCMAQAELYPTVYIINVSNSTFPNMLSYYQDQNQDGKCSSANPVLYLSGDSLIYYDSFQLEILDVSNLTSPTLLNSSDVLFNPVSMILSSDGKTAFVIDQDTDVDQNPISLKALNLTNPNSIQKIGALVLGPLDNDVSGLGVMAISPDNNYIFVAGYNKLLVVDVSDLQNMTSKTVDMISEPTFVALSPDGRSLFVTNGIQVTILELYIDSQTSQKFTLPSSATIQEFTLPQNSSWGVLDDMIISSDQNTAFVTYYNNSYLAIFDMSNKDAPTLLDITPYNPIDSITISLDERTVFLAFMDEILLLDISNLTTPTLINTLPADGSGGSQLFAISSDGQIAFIMAFQGFQVVNISDMATPINISSYNSSVGNYDLPVALTLSQDEKTIFLLVWENITTYVLQTIDISNLSSPKLVTYFSIQVGSDNEGSVESDVFHVSISPDNKAAFFGLNNDGNNLQVFDLSNPALPIEVDWSDLNINASQRVLISSDSSTAFIATLQELLVIDITRLATPQILRSYPIIDTVSMFLSNDESTMYLAALNGTWIEVNLQPQYTFEMWSNDFVLGEVYSNTLEAFQINQNNYLGPMSQNYSFATVSLYSVTSLPGTKNTETQTTYPLLPNWIEFDQSHGIVTFKPNTQDQIGQYQLYSALSFSIPDGIFVNTSIANITDQTESLDLIVSLITLGYMNNQGFLTSSFNSSNKLYLPSQYSPYEPDIRNLLSQYYIEMTTTFAVDSSLSLSASRHILINTKSENTISVTISIYEPTNILDQAQFVKGNYPIIATYSSDNSTITMEGTLNSINSALTEIIINLNDDVTSYNGSIIVSDGLSPVLLKNLTNISSYFVLNQAPVIGDSIQSQVSKTQIYTGEQFIISINDSFVDSNSQDLEYSVAMQDSNQQVPDWLTLRDSSLVGTPPEQVTDSEINIVIIAKNQFKSSQQLVTINIKISLLYALKLIGTYGGALITIVGLWIYMSTIHNIFCKKRYRYPKDLYIKVGDEQSVRNICTISFIAKEIKAAKIVLNEIKKTIATECNIKNPKDSDIAAYFIDSKSGKFDEDKFVDITKDAISKLGVVDMDQSNESSFIKGYLRKEVIQQLVLDKILHYQLSLKNEKDTKNIFEKVKKYWISFIETTSDPLQYRLNRTELRKTLKEKGILKSYLSAPDNELISSDKGHINNAEDTIEVNNEHQVSHFDEEPALSGKPDKQTETPLLQKQSPKSKRSQINVDLLERLLIGTAFKYHNLDMNVYETKVVISQKPFGNTLWLKIKKIFKRDLARIKFTGKGEAVYGIRYEVNEDVLRFYGAPREGLKGSTLVVQVTTQRGWILRELWLHCIVGSVKIENKDL